MIRLFLIKNATIKASTTKVENKRIIIETVNCEIKNLNKEINILHIEKLKELRELMKGNNGQFNKLEKEIANWQNFVEFYKNDEKKLEIVRKQLNEAKDAFDEKECEMANKFEQICQKYDNMKLETISIKNYRQYRDVEIEFDTNPSKNFTIIKGNNGTGKTTLLNAFNWCLYGKEIHSYGQKEGMSLCNNKSVTLADINEDIPVDTGKIFLESEYGKNTINTNDIGYVVSTPVVPEFLTGKEFLKFYLEINPDKNLKTIDEYFEMVQIDKKDQDKLLRDYSHGMKNKMQILINVIANPKVILLDEPLTSLDIVVQEEMKNLLKSLKKDHIIIFSTHILELALDLCDDIVLLNNKKLSAVEKDEINTKNYKEKIIKALKDESND